MALLAFLLLAFLPALASASEVTVCGAKAQSSDTAIDLSGAKQSYKALAQELTLLPELQSAQLGLTALKPTELKKLRDLYPNVAFAYQIKMYGQTVDSDAEELDLGDMVVRDADKLMEYMSCLAKLRKLTAYGSRFGKKQIEALTQGYPSVDFHVTLCANGHYVRTDATSFTTLHGDESARHSDFSILAYCKELRAIDIGHNSVKDLSFLKELKHLKLLVLADNRIADLSPLMGLSELEYVELFMNRITDLTPLMGLPNLLDINLVDNEIADVAPLLRCPKLERAWLGRNPIPKAQYDEAQLALPNCEFNFTVSNCTGDGWRLHPRHKVKRRVFEGGSYVPWDWKPEDDVD